MSFFSLLDAGRGACATLLLLNAMPLVSQAQTAVGAPADTARFYRHHLGLTASPQLDHFFTANRTLPLGLLYKRQLRPGRAMRVRLVGYYSSNDTSNYLTKLPTNMFLGYVEGPNARTWELNAFVGYEWQKALGRRWSYTYGAELGGGFRRRSTDYLFQFSSPIQPNLVPEVITSTDNTWQLQARPFVGLQYRVARSVSVFLESAVALRYTHRTTEYDKLQTYNTYITTGEGHTRTNRFSVLWYPIQLVGAAVHF